MGTLLFRKGLKPMWEEFPTGGCWIVRMKGKNRKTSINQMWENLLLVMIGESFGTRDVCGCVLSKRLRDTVFSVWNATSKDESVRFHIGEKLRDVLGLDMNSSIQYKEHEKSLQDFSTFRNAKKYKFTLLPMLSPEGSPSATPSASPAVTPVMKPSTLVPMPMDDISPLPPTEEFEVEKKIALNPEAKNFSPTSCPLGVPKYTSGRTNPLNPSARNSDPSNVSSAQERSSLNAPALGSCMLVAPSGADPATQSLLSSLEAEFTGGAELKADAKRVRTKLSSKARPWLPGSAVPKLASVATSQVNYSTTNLTNVVPGTTVSTSTGDAKASEMEK